MCLMCMRTPLRRKRGKKNSRTRRPPCAWGSYGLATRAIATGYTLGSDPSAKASFAQAVGYLQVYVNDIESILGQGHLKPETAALLVSQANTLIQQVGALAN